MNKTVVFASLLLLAALPACEHSKKKCTSCSHTTEQVVEEQAAQETATPDAAPADKF